MFVNTAQPIIGYDGDPMIFEQDGKQITVRWAIQHCLNAPIGSEPWTPESVMDCARLSKMAFTKDGEEVNYSETDRAFIMKRSEALTIQGQSTPAIHAFLVEVLKDPAPSNPEPDTSTLDTKQESEPDA